MVDLGIIEKRCGRKFCWSEIILFLFAIFCFFLSKILFAEILGGLNSFWVGYVSPNHLVGTR